MYQEKEEDRNLNSMEFPEKREVPTNAFHLPEPKKMKFGGEEKSSGPPPPVPPATRVVLNPADCDLDFSIKEDGLHASALYEQGFAYCWSGARANVGINGGKYCFGCKIIAAQPVNMDDTPLDQQHLCRIGISRGDDPVGNLGETLNSFGFGGTGKVSNAGIFSGYGETFGVGDTIIFCVDLESKPMASIGFSKNGKWLGIAKRFDAGPGGLGVVDSQVKMFPWESAVFPHILLKNVIVQLQFSTEDGLVPQEGYSPWSFAIQERKMILGPTFPDSSDCEVIMMVGLPAAGKTTWAEKWARAHPEKRYILLGTNLALDQMKVPGLHRKNNYGERFDRLMDRATGIFSTLLSRASKMSRNFIIDQTNVYKSARKRKLKPFADYHKIAVVVFPRPEEMKSRADERYREMGKEVPVDAVNEMLANYTLPMSKDMRNTNEYFDEVWFPELTRGEAQRHLDEMKANLILKRDGASNSRQGFGHSVESDTSPLVQNQGSLPGIGGQWPSPYITQPSTGAPPTSYNSVSFGYSGNNFNHQYATDSRSHENSRNVYQSGRYPSPSPYLGFNFFQSEAYGEHPHFGENYNKSRSTAQGSMDEVCQSYGVGYTYGHPCVGSGNVSSGGAADFNSRQMIEGHPRMPVFPYNTGNTYPSQSPLPPDLVPTRTPVSGSSTLAPYGHPRMPVFPYNTGNTYPSQTPLPSDLVPTRTPVSGSSTLAPYGSPFATPLQGSGHGGFPEDTQHTQGSASPHPGYY